MKVRMVEQYVSPKLNLQPGQIVDLPVKLARSLVKARSAVKASDDPLAQQQERRERSSKARADRAAKDAEAAAREAEQAAGDGSAGDGDQSPASGGDNT